MNKNKRYNHLLKTGNLVLRPSAHSAVTPACPATRYVSRGVGRRSQFPFCKAPRHPLSARSFAHSAFVRARFSHTPDHVRKDGTTPGLS